MTNLGAPIVGKTVTGRCDGRCDADARITTDGQRWTATFTPERSGWQPGEFETVEVDGNLAYTRCPSVHVESEEVCGGSITVNVPTLLAEPGWIALPVGFERAAVTPA